MQSIPDDEVEKPPQFPASIASPLEVLIDDRLDKGSAKKRDGTEGSGGKIIEEELAELTAEPLRVRHLQPNLPFAKNLARQVKAHRLLEQVF